MMRACCVILLAAACSRDEPRVDLEPVPAVDLDVLDARTARQIRESRKRDDPGALGMVYHAYDLVPAALACYRNAARIDPDGYRWPYYTSLIQLKGGDIEGARTSFLAAARLMGEGAPTEHRHHLYAAMSAP